MAEWRRIGCAVDFSETSRRAMEEAADLSRRFGASLLVFHVLELEEAPADMPPPPDVVERTRADLASRLEEWRAEAERRSGGRVASELATGPAAAEIARLAAERELDLVVTGTHGRRGLRHLVLGSVAEQVVRTAPCEVLVVRARP